MKRFCSAGPVSGVKGAGFDVRPTIRHEGRISFASGVLIMRTLLMGASVLLAAGLAGCSAVPSVPLPSFGGEAPSETAASRLKTSDLTGLGGKDWAGTLTYLDYGSGERVAIPVTADITVKLNCLGLGLIYPGEPEANSIDEICISEDGSGFDGAPLISLQRLGPDFIAFQTETDGTDDNKPARIRQNYILSRSAFTSGKEVSFDDGDTWIERNEFDLER